MSLTYTLIQKKRGSKNSLNWNKQKAIINDLALHDMILTNISNTMNADDLTPLIHNLIIQPEFVSFFLPHNQLDLLIPCN